MPNNIKTKTTWRRLKRSVNEQLLVTLGILSLCILLLALNTPPWLTLSLALLLIFIQLLLYIQTYFFALLKAKSEAGANDSGSID
ncbi:MAG: hypothetical protein ED555_04800 [Allomuricauda sp.]|nr:MAG: hypothetical protein ED555_04800 [Allomuricauda sp.]